MCLYIVASLGSYLGYVGHAKTRNFHWKLTEYFHQAPLCEARTKRDVRLHHLHLYDLDEAREHGVPADSDQRHIGEDLRDHHGGQSRHLRTVAGDPSVSHRAFPRRTLRIVFSWEVGAASTAYEHPSLHHQWTGSGWGERRLATKNGCYPCPTATSKSRPAARWHCSFSGEVRQQWDACVRRGPRTRKKPWWLEPLQDGDAMKTRYSPTGPEGHRPLWF